MFLRIISRGQPWIFDDPEDVTIETRQEITFEVDSEGDLRIFHYKQEEQEERDCVQKKPIL